MSENKRVVFYYVNDISSWLNREKSEILLYSIDLDKEFLLIDYLEYYKIRIIFEILISLWRIQKRKNWNNFIC